MPMHDWTRVKAGTYHGFHYRWVAAIMDRLNAGLLPPGFFAYPEQIIGGPEGDVVTLQTGLRPDTPAQRGNGVAVTTVQPNTRFVLPLKRDAERYARKANQVAIRDELGELVAVIEVVSPGNKDRKRSLDTFVAKAVDLILHQINLLIVDPFPPGKHDPQGIHAAIWEEFADQSFVMPADKPLTLAAYQAQGTQTAYVEPVAVGDRLPNMPLFLFDEHYINVPLEETYQATWDVLPVEVRRLLEPSEQER